MGQPRPELHQSAFELIISHVISRYTGYYWFNYAMQRSLKMHYLRAQD